MNILYFKGLNYFVLVLNSLKPFCLSSEQDFIISVSIENNSKSVKHLVNFLKLISRIFKNVLKNKNVIFKNCLKHFKPKCFNVLRQQLCSHEVKNGCKN